MASTAHRSLAKEAHRVQHGSGSVGVDSKSLALGGGGMGSGGSVQKSASAERSEFASYRDDFHKVRRYRTSEIGRRTGRPCGVVLRRRLRQRSEKVIRTCVVLLAV